MLAVYLRLSELAVLATQRDGHTKNLRNGQLFLYPRVPHMTHGVQVLHARTIFAVGSNDSEHGVE